MSFLPGTREGLYEKTKTVPPRLAAACGWEDSVVQEEYEEDPMEFDEAQVRSCMKRVPHDSLSAVSNTWDPKGAQSAHVSAARKARRA